MSNYLPPPPPNPMAMGSSSIPNYYPFPSSSSSSPPSTSSSSSSYTYTHPSSSGGSNFPIIAIAIIGILATAFLLVSYYIFVIKCCLNWHRIDFLRRLSLSRHSPSSFHNHHHPPSSDQSQPPSAPKGLDDALIRLIPVIRFRREADKDDERDQQHFECAVCLSEFREGEKLRVIPNCCHAFHIDCIDVWLQTNANCPLCRSSISPNSLCPIGRIVDNHNHPKFPNNASGGGSNNNPRNSDPGNDDDGFVVIEIRGNNLDEPRLVSRQEIRVSESGEREYSSPTTTVAGVGTSSSSRCSKGEQNREKSSSSSSSLSSQQRVVTSLDDEYVDIIAKKKNNKGGGGGDGDGKLSSSFGSGRVQPFRRSVSLDLTGHRQLCAEIREIVEKRREEGGGAGEVTAAGTEEECSGSSNNGGNSGRVRRSFFSFGSGKFGGGSRSSVLPL